MREPSDDIYEFQSKLVGVTYLNSDGRSRQLVVRSSAAGERLTLIREPANRDANAVFVTRGNGDGLGHLDKRTAAQIAPELDRGGMVQCIVTAVTGGTYDKPTFGLNIMLVIGEIDLTINVTRNGVTGTDPPPGGYPGATAFTEESPKIPGILWVTVAAILGAALFIWLIHG